MIFYLLLINLFLNINIVCMESPVENDGTKLCEDWFFLNASPKASERRIDTSDSTGSSDAVANDGYSLTPENTDTTKILTDAPAVTLVKSKSAKSIEELPNPNISPTLVPMRAEAPLSLKPANGVVTPNVSAIQEPVSPDNSTPLLEDSTKQAEDKKRRCFATCRRKANITVNKKNGHYKLCCFGGAATCLLIYLGIMNKGI